MPVGSFSNQQIFVLGRIVVEAVDIKMVRLPPSVAFIARITSTAIIFSLAFIGILLSGTYVLRSAIIGTGIATKAKVNFRMTEVFSIAWIPSFVCPGILAAITVLILRLL